MNAVNEKKNWKKKLLREMANYWLTVLYMAVVFSVFFNYVIVRLDLITKLVQKFKRCFLRFGIFIYSFSIFRY